MKKGWLIVLINAIVIIFVTIAYFLFVEIISPEKVEIKELELIKEVIVEKRIDNPPVVSYLKNKDETQIYLTYFVDEDIYQEIRFKEKRSVDFLKEQYIVTVVGRSQMPDFESDKKKLVFEINIKNNIFNSDVLEKLENYNFTKYFLNNHVEQK